MFDVLNSLRWKIKLFYSKSKIFNFIISNQFNLTYWPRQEFMFHFCIFYFSEQWNVSQHIMRLTSDFAVREAWWCLPFSLISSSFNKIQFLLLLLLMLARPFKKKINCFQFISYCVTYKLFFCPARFNCVYN